MTNQMISAQGLTKTFRSKGQTVEAVRAVDLTVAQGELVAFLGPNGAGKSTTLRMLTTLLPPTSGDALVAGCDIRRDPAGVRRRIGYVGQGTSGGHTQRVRDELRAQGAFYGMPRRETRARAAELIESLELAAVADRAVQSLSGGQKRRLDIALGLIHRPELLFLDEPSTGLDPHSRANLWEHIVRLREDTGTTIFLTTHYLDEADQLAERVMVMDHGEVIADDTAASLKHSLAGDRLTLAFATSTDASAAAARIAAATGAIAATRIAGTTAEAAARFAGDASTARPASTASTGASVGTVGTATPGSADERGRAREPRSGEPSVIVDGSVVTVTATDADRLLPRVIRDLGDARLEVVSATHRSPTLDDVFLALTGRSLREESASAAAEPVPA
ncbi:ABC transporter ATP-binding protein [Agromyces aerolatus]|uniref:ABC transporter ATP-binding protein n=1 Tax=Agromyces sp. LY-1074 TaxID=3074080 RepID=UPI002860E211|nr:MULTISPECIES: ATP-binding cassette domain-containing protein [unclassified Agromyces]MDR5701548.1 ATP-binding cassette domain-containing protein [Agromyces sp. LY-1074]MDR5707845.1 ATP-binding cassette domain-containing protein [Agromyces sp. LY-1358]